MVKRGSEKESEGRDKSELVKVAPAEMIAAMGADANSGFEEAGAEAFATPFLLILQRLSPQVDDKSPQFVEGARPGDILNSVTREIIDGDVGALVIPVHYKRSFIEWTPREDGGGFVKDHGPNPQQLLATAHRNEKGQDTLPSGNIIVDTRSHFVLVINEANDTFGPAIVNMTSTQMKHSRRWMSIMQGIKIKDSQGSMFTPPMFSHFYRLKTASESNKKGTWSGWKISNDGIVDNAGYYAAAKEFKAAVEKMVVRPTYFDPAEAAAESEM